MQKIRRVHPLALTVSFLLLIVLLFGMTFAALHQGDKVRFGYTAGAHAFGAAHLLSASSSQYVCTAYSTEEVLLRALDNDLLDAALLPVESALKLPEDVYALHGVFSVLDLLAVSSDETMLDIGSLSGRVLILPEKLQGSKEEKMLNELLLEADAAGYTIRFAADCVKTYQQTPGSVMLLPMDDLEAAVKQDATLSVRFRLSQQWRNLLLSTAPAGYCVVYRREIAGTNTFISFEKALRSSMTYADRKRKKTIAMAVGCGLFESEMPADLLIDQMSFSYLEGDEMLSSLKAYQTL